MAPDLGCLPAARQTSPHDPWYASSQHAALSSTKMPVVHHATKEIQLKIVYYGPGLGGKTTNLKYLHAASRPDLRGKLLSFTTESDRTYFFDLLPVELGLFHGYQIRLHLCTVPGQIALDSTRRLVLRHVDGVVFVVDSQIEALSANIESIRNLETNLRLQGDDPDRIPLVVQYNKRDLPNVIPTDELGVALKVPLEVVEVEACARSGLGVGATLKAIVKECLRLVPNPRRAKEGRTPSILPGVRASMYPDALPASFEIPRFPAPPKVPLVLDDEPTLPRRRGDSSG
jgi:signal recognition particle receptor subunit beta